MIALTMLLPFSEGCSLDNGLFDNIGVKEFSSIPEIGHRVVVKGVEWWIDKIIYHEDIEAGEPVGVAILTNEVFENIKYQEIRRESFLKCVPLVVMVVVVVFLIMAHTLWSNKDLLLKYFL